ncbi:hypothetical protein M231_04040 [Tremella mesenterica]|uniref:DDH domain-containing protein n=1 Tax=Tremella mesenterica TaxID=5217 RepID=A0A4Q1BM15_TREME|nr:hypothetical protein M231_04040 [Tremella mesenterica]
MKREASSPASPSSKRRRRSSTPELKPVISSFSSVSEFGSQWDEWPAPRADMTAAREFIIDIVKEKRSVVIVPDKDADGLSAGTLLYKTLRLLGHPPELISVHHLQKGTNVHTNEERARLAQFGVDRAVVLDQGSRPGPSLLPTGDPSTMNVLIVDHHMSTEWPEGSKVLTACRTPPIATAALLTYMLLRDLHPAVTEKEGWRAVMGVIGGADLGTTTAKWGNPPWPGASADSHRHGAKTMSEAVASINAPRRTAEYNGQAECQIFLNADKASDIATNAFLKLCKLDVNDETLRWARTPPRFTTDGRVAVITIHTGFQVHPVIATRWAGTLGKKSKNLIMIMCANTGFNPDPSKVSFSCRIAANLRSLPDGERPDLIGMLNEYGNGIEGFRERVGGDFARGHKEATGGIIHKDEFALLLAHMGVPPEGTPRKNTPKKAPPKVVDSSQKTGIKDYFKPVSAVLEGDAK